MMRELSGRRMRVLIAALMALALMPGLSRVAALPEEIVLRAGGAVELPVSALMRADVSNGDGVSADFNGAEGLKLTAGGVGTSRISYSLLGLLPVKTVNVSVEPEKRLIPGGRSVGIAIDTAGVVVVGASDLGRVPSPARLAGIRSGDIIQRVNGAAIDSAEALSEHVSGSDALTLEIQRNGKAVSCIVNPAMDERDGQWRLGAWVRDSTAGVGTLTFIDPDSGLFGALGHAITDVDTSVTMPVGVGELYENRVVDVNPSRHGKPGELTGDFVFHPEAIGTVEHNSERGIFGHIEWDRADCLYPDGLPIARRDEIHTGAASILTTVDGGETREYACDIVRVNEGGDTRSLVIRVTDPALVEKTGGIVQGMSGSPILQDGRLAGAVTHVMINEPTMGYGVTIDAMLEEAQSMTDAAKAASVL